MAHFAEMTGKFLNVKVTLFRGDRSFRRRAATRETKIKPALQRKTVIDRQLARKSLSVDLLLVAS